MKCIFYGLYFCDYKWSICPLCGRCACLGECNQSIDSAGSNPKVMTQSMQMIQSLSQVSLELDSTVSAQESKKPRQSLCRNCENVGCIGSSCRGKKGLLCDAACKLNCGLLDCHGGNIIKCLTHGKYVDRKSTTLPKRFGVCLNCQRFACPGADNYKKGLACHVACLFQCGIPDCHGGSVVSCLSKKPQVLTEQAQDAVVPRIQAVVKGPVANVVKAIDPKTSEVNIGEKEGPPEPIAILAKASEISGNLQLTDEIFMPISSPKASPENRPSFNANGQTIETGANRSVETDSIKSERIL